MSTIKSWIIGLLFVVAIGPAMFNFIPRQLLAVANDIQGHFTTKIKPESAWIAAPTLNADKTGCVGECEVKLTFSDYDVPPVIVKNCIGGNLVNLGDLDNDGLDEIGFLPEGFAGCWHQYLVYTYKKGKWIYAVQPFDTHCNQWEQKLAPIVVDPDKPGNVIITYSATEGGEIVSKTKSVAVK